MPDANCPMPSMKPTFGSLFAGLGGFDLALERCGFECRWQVEINPDANKVLERQWPDVKRHKDIHDVGRNNLEPVDVICGGFPCQDLSVAGKRGGLKGERSGLFFEATRVIDQLRPSLVLLENVPGLLSSSEGNDFQIVINTLTQMGYACDVDIKDAQEFGVPQRRRRVFIVCARLDGLLQKRTPFSDNILMDLTLQWLLTRWDGILQASSPELLPLGFESHTEGWRGSPQKRMQQFAGLLGSNPQLRLDGYWGIEHLEQSLSEWTDSVSAGMDDGPGHISTVEATGSYQTETAQDGEHGSESTSRSSRRALDGNSGEVRSSTTLMETPLTISLKICICAETMLSTLRSIVPLIGWCESSWQSASLCSTMLKELTDCARQASRELFTDDALRSRWRDCLNASLDIEVEFERCARAACASEIFPEPESSRRDSATSRGQRCGFARRIPTGAGERGGRSSRVRSFTASEQSNSYAWLSDVYLTINAQAPSDTSNIQYGILEEIYCPDTAASLTAGTASGSGVNPPGRRREDDTNLVFTSSGFGKFKAAVGSLRANGGDVGPGSENLVAGPLTARHGKGINTSLDDGALVTHPLTRRHDSSEDGCGRGTPLISEPGTFGVRRLMPIECERLQGLPDNWTKGLSDSARYRLIGNGVAVPVIEWIGRRLIQHIKAATEDVA